MSWILPALRDRRFLVTAWPWRSFAYLATGAVVAAPIALGTWMLALPWIAAVDRAPSGPHIFLMIVSPILLLVFGPLVAVPLAALERWRLALADDRPIANGLGAIRYADGATWRAVAYGLVFTLAGPVVYFGLGLAAAILAGFVVSPLLAGTGTVDFQVGPFDIRGTGPALLLCATGLALIVPFVYLTSLIAAGQAALARLLLDTRTRPRAASSPAPRSAPPADPPSPASPATTASAGAPHPPSA